MVLAELGTQLTQAIAKLNKSYNVDDKVIDDFLKDISNALLKVFLLYK